MALRLKKKNIRNKKETLKINSEMLETWDSLLKVPEKTATTLKEIKKFCKESGLVYSDVKESLKIFREKKYQEEREQKEQARKNIAEEERKKEESDLVKKQIMRAERIAQAEKDFRELEEKGKKEAETLGNNFSRLILELLARKKWNSAVEETVQALEKNERFYTIRDDKHPEMWIYDYDKGIVKKHAETYVKSFCREILGQAYSKSFFNSVLEKIQADTFIESEEFFNQNNFDEVCLLNGILNLKTKTLTPHSPDKIFFQLVPVNFVSGADCPSIKKFLSEVLKNPKEDSQIYFELCGSLLYREYFIQKAAMFNGKGRNGKTISLAVIKNFIGERNISGVKLQELKGFSRCELLNKLANISGELSDEALEDTGDFKEMTGGDYIDADQKFSSHVRFKNYAKLIYSCNVLPRPSDNSLAFWARWILLDFPYTFISKKEFDTLAEDEKKVSRIANPAILKDLITDSELSGLLNESLFGLDRLFKNGDFSYSQSIKETSKEWIRRADSFAAFCEDELVFDYGKVMSFSYLKSLYLQYCSRNQSKVVEKKWLRNFLESRNCWFEKRRLGIKDGESPVWVIIGVREKVIDDKANYIDDNKKYTLDKIKVEKFFVPEVTDVTYPETRLKVEIPSYKLESTSHLEQLEQPSNNNYYMVTAKKAEKIHKMAQGTSKLPPTTHNNQLE